MRHPPGWLAALLAAGLALAGCERAQPDDAEAVRAVPATSSATMPPGPPGDDASDPPGPPAASIRFVAGAPASGETLADDIVRGLSTDVRVLACDQGVVDGRSAFAPDWVLAHRVDLDDDGRADWLVEGRHPCLSDADGADWWLYAENAAGRSLLLAAGRARAVEALPSRSHGFRDLRLQREGDRDLEVRHDGAVYVASPVIRD
ncbi:MULTISPECIES: hypothetical protein [unclassified Luteimonas]